MSQIEKTPNKEKRPLKTEPKLKVDLNEEQKEFVKLFYEYDVCFLHGDFGCLGKGTEVLMYDGTYKKVEDIIVGDTLMGVDSTPRNVIELKRGIEQMYWVRQNKGDDYRVNENHILSLKRVVPAKYPRITIEGKRVQDFTKQPIHDKKVSVVNISVKDYLELPSKNQYVGYISPCIHFEEKKLIIDPYYLGLWLGDGNKRDIKQITNTDSEIIDYLRSLGCEVFTKKSDSISHYFKEDCINLNDKFNKLYNLTNIASLTEKYIPNDYIYNTKENRLKLLAGLLDSDGHYISDGKYYEIIQKNKLISEQIAFLSRSLGYKTNIRTKITTMKRKDGSIYSCEVYRISIMPLDIIPVKIERKKNTIGNEFKDRTHTGIKIEKDIVDNYYGFTLDGDSLFLLKDLTVTHNSGKSLAAVHTALTAFRKKQFNNIWITRPMLKNNLAALPGNLEEKMSPYTFPITQNMEVCQGKEITDKMLKEGLIKIMPIEVAKGCSFIDAVVIVDEYQDMSYQDFRTILTRLSKGSKMIFCGSKQQIDKQIAKNSCIYDTMKLEDSGLVGYKTLTSNHRNPVLTDIIQFLENNQK